MGALGRNLFHEFYFSLVPLIPYSAIAKTILVSGIFEPVTCRLTPSGNSRAVYPVLVFKLYKIQKKQFPIDYTG